jgi:hypothetical protein
MSSSAFNRAASRRRFSLDACHVYPQHLHDHGGAGEPEVDADESIGGAGQHDLGVGTRESGRGDESKELPLQPTVSAAHRLGSFDRSQQRRDAVAARPTEGNDSTMQRILAESAVSEAVVERDPQLCLRFGARQIDQGPSSTGHRQFADHRAVDEVEIADLMDAMPKARHVSIATDRQIEWWLEGVPTEPVQGRCCVTTDDNIATDIDHERVQFGERISR